MTNAEALQLVAVLTAYYRQEIADETAMLWARELTSFEVEDGMEAAHILGTSGRFLPPLADYLDTIRECRNDRLKRERLALPHPERYPDATCDLVEFLDDNPDWKARWDALKNGDGPLVAVVSSSLSRTWEDDLA